MKKDLFENCGIIEYEGDRYMLTDSAASWYEYNSSDPDGVYFRHWAYKLIGDDIEVDEYDDPVLYAFWFLCGDTEHPDDVLDPENIDYDSPTFLS